MSENLDCKRYGIPKKGWHIRIGPQCMVYYNGEVVGGIQKINISVDISNTTPKMTLDILIPESNVDGKNISATIETSSSSREFSSRFPRRIHNNGR